MYSVSKEDEIADYLVARCPSLTRTRNFTGLLPLELALETGRTWNSGVRHLVRGHPSSLARRDHRSRLFPFQVAASYGSIRDSQEEDFEQSMLPPSAKRPRTSDGEDMLLISGVEDPSTAKLDERRLSERAEAQTVTTIYRLLREFPCRIRF